MDDKPARKLEFGVTPTDVMASMAGIDFVRAMFAGQLPAPPIMQTVEPFDCTAEPGVVVIHSVPGFRHYNPIGSVHGGYAAIAGFGDGARGSDHAAGRHRLHHARIQDQLHPGHDQGHRPGAHRRPHAHVGRRAATAEARITDAKGRLLAHATTTCLVFEIPKETLTEAAALLPLLALLGEGK